MHIQDVYSSIPLTLSLRDQTGQHRQTDGILPSILQYQQLREDTAPRTRRKYGRALSVEA